jgi:LacI family transcriptional regulator
MPRGDPVSRPTMADVARHAGVTVATVSRALGEGTAGELRPETVERVRQAAQALGYRPNRLARALRTQQSRTVGVVVPDLANPFMPSVIAGLEDVLGLAGVAPLVMNTDNDPDREERAVRALLEHQVDGLVVASARLGADWKGPEWAAMVPTVLMNRRSAHAIPAVIADDLGGAAAVVGHLVGLGHRRIVHIAGPADLGSTADREAGFLAAMEQAAMGQAAMGQEEADAPRVLRATRVTIDEGVRLCRELVATGIEATAVFAANDLLAMGCLKVLREQGIRVPDDVSLVGFNDMVAIDLLEPPLTTIRVPQRELGRRSGEAILELMRDGAGAGPTDPVRLPCELVVRGSTGPPPAPSPATSPRATGVGRPRSRVDRSLDQD